MPVITSSLHALLVRNQHMTSLRRLPRQPHFPGPKHETNYCRHLGLRESNEHSKLT